MNHKMLCFLTYCLVCINAYADNFRQISSKEGLSNSSITCMLQDSRRFLWVGTFDGLNCYDSKDIHIYKPDINNQNSLSSNVIRNIVETENNYLWISTKQGLNKLSQRNNRIEEYYDEFKDDSRIASDSRGNIFVLGKKGFISLYDKNKRHFVDLPVNSEIESVRTAFFIDPKDTIYITYNGKIERYTVNTDHPDRPIILQHPNFSHPYRIDYAFYDKEQILFIDSLGDLFVSDLEQTVFIRNIHALIEDNGVIDAMIFDGSNILIGFRTSGLFCLRSQMHFEPEKMKINCGVFSLLKDERQNIVWIGTDGQGVYEWTKDNYSFKSITLNQLPVKKERPVRAIVTDAFDNLWFGTKDNGVIRIGKYKNSTDYTPANVEHFTTNEGLSNDAVFALTCSNKKQVMWIGSDGPDLNYYSYSDGKIHTLKKNMATQFSYIHSLLEIGDSALYAGTGNSLLKIFIQRRGNELEAIASKRFNFNVINNQIFNQIFALKMENDSILWIGMRGNGLIRFNTQTEGYRLFTFDENGIAPMNDILCIHQDRNKCLWLGTSYGLIRFQMRPDGSYEYKNYNENSGLPNNTIHGILENSKGELWLSSNTGIMLFDTSKETFRRFNQKTGLKIIEFCDNAYFKNESDGVCFFGGVDGIVEIQQEKNEIKHFVPDIYFTGLRVFNQNYNIHDFEKVKNNKPYIELNHKQNFFTITFVAMDFINGGNSHYSYQLQNFSDVWINTSSNEAQFTNIPPGSYSLKVKYQDGITKGENPVQQIAIVIQPPWYITWYAKVIYTLIAAGLLFLVWLLIKNRYEEKKRNMTRFLDEKYKEELQERKLRFFTNITHEFCMPLTLIYGPCERILNHDGSDSFVKKYAKIIKSNTERLNNLIQEVIDFRRMETGNKICHIQRLNISRLLSEIAESLNELAERNHISFQLLYDQEIIWNTDCDCFLKIINNLVSNAFKYTPTEGQIVVSVNIAENILKLTVYNTGKGIRQEDIPRIFNRYTVLDNIKENAIKELSSRNGLGMAICLSMTELLQGTIEVDSEINKYVRFTVSLPYLEVTEGTGEDRPASTNLLNPSEFIKETESVSDEFQEEFAAPEKGKMRILVIDDNKDLLYMIKETLSAEYTIITASDGEKGLQVLKQSMPDLIITDIMMPHLDGILLTQQLKQNRHTMHIPLIILSAKNMTNDRIEGFESGADAYISKPFDEKYLKTVIKRLIINRKSMEEYYNSSASAYEYSSGQLLEKEDKEFLQAAIGIIHENLDKTEFLPENMAECLNISVRNLYRKLKTLGQPSPKDFIKEQRLIHAAKLLQTSNQTIQEIMYKTGFSNRSHFYNEFSKRHGLKPKEYRTRNKLSDDSL
ncbi:MAG: response regulator [Dysgonamonadaceae bacterium]|nr:response regulator [Dysgonamonadaceae bacterium]